MHSSPSHTQKCRKARKVKTKKVMKTKSKNSPKQATKVMAMEKKAMPAMATKKVDAREYKKDKAMFALATQKAKKVVKQVMAAKPVSLSDDSDVDDTKEDMETKSTSKAMKAMAMKKAMKATSAAKRKRIVDDDDSDIDAKVPSKRFSKDLKSIEKVRKSNEKKTPAPKNQRAKRPYAHRPCLIFRFSIRSKSVMR